MRTKIMKIKSSQDPPNTDYYIFSLFHNVHLTMDSLSKFLSRTIPVYSKCERCTDEQITEIYLKSE